MNAVLFSLLNLSQSPININDLVSGHQSLVHLQIILKVTEKTPASTETKCQIEWEPWI